MKISKGFNQQFAEIHFFQRELLLNFTTTYPEMKYCCHVILLVVVCIRTSPNPKQYGFFKVPVVYAPKLLSVFSTVWNTGEETSKICRQQISVPTTRKKKSISRFCG